MRLSSALSAKFVTAKVLLITFEIRDDTRCQDITSWRKVLWPFRSVKVRAHRQDSAPHSRERI